MGLDLVAMDAALKQHYTKDYIENMVYKDNPLHAMLAKMTEFGGRNLPIVTIHGNPQGRSRAFSKAQSKGATSSSKLQDFLLTRVKDYSIATIDNETLEASKGDMNAFLEAATLEIDGAINSLVRSTAIAEYRTGYGEIGQVAAISSATVTLANINDISNFELDQDINFASGISSGALRGTSPNQFLTIVSLDRNLGTMTFNANVSTLSGGGGSVAVNDYMFMAGDRDDSASPARGKISGLEAWNPAVAPTSGDSFFSVDRSVDPSRLAGQRLDGTNAPIEEVLIDADARVSREGGRLSHFFMHSFKYSELEKSLGSKVQYVDLKVNAQIGFRGIQIQGQKGTIMVIPDQNCPSSRVHGLSLPHWKLYSLGDACRVIDTDGLKMLRQAAADGVECRYGGYMNMGCRAPGWNINIQV